MNQITHRYDFIDLLARLKELTNWLDSIGISSPGRLQRYRQNIQRMLDAEARGKMEELQKTLGWEAAREVLWSYVEADEMVRALEALRPHDDASLRLQIARGLKGPTDLFLENRDNHQGRSFAFELIVGGRLAAAGYAPKYGNHADVEFEFATMNIGVQCKRPLSEKKLERHIHEAIRQIDEGTTEHGIVAISVSRIINPGEPTMMPVFWFSVKMRVNLIEEGFRPAGGDFQGMRIYRSDMFLLFLGGEASRRPGLIIVRDESARLSLGMVASPQSLLPFHLT